MRILLACHSGIKGVPANLKGNRGRPIDASIQREPLFRASSPSAVASPVCKFEASTKFLPRLRFLLKAAWELAPLPALIGNDYGFAAQQRFGKSFYKHSEIVWLQTFLVLIQLGEPQPKSFVVDCPKLRPMSRYFLHEPDLVVSDLLAVANRKALCQKLQTVLDLWRVQAIAMYQVNTLTSNFKEAQPWGEAPDFCIMMSYWTLMRYCIFYNVSYARS